MAIILVHVRMYVRTYVYILVYIFSVFFHSYVRTYTVAGGSAGGVIPSVLLQDTPMLSASFEDPSMCIDCEKGVCDSCPLHHRWKRMRNNNCYFDPNGLSQVKVPGWAAVATSKIPGAGLGLFAQQKVKYGVHLGHYKGVHRDPSTVSKNEDMSYAWEVSHPHACTCVCCTCEHHICFAKCP